MRRPLVGRSADFGSDISLAAGSIRENYALQRSERGGLGQNSVCERIENETA